MVSEHRAVYVSKVSTDITNLHAETHKIENISLIK